MLPKLRLLLLCWILELLDVLFLLVVFFLNLVMWVFLVLLVLWIKKRSWKNIYIYCFFYILNFFFFPYEFLFANRTSLFFLSYWIGMNDFVRIVFFNLFLFLSGDEWIWEHLFFVFIFMLCFEFVRDFKVGWIESKFYELWCLRKKWKPIDLLLGCSSFGVGTNEIQKMNIERFDLEFFPKQSNLWIYIYIKKISYSIIFVDFSIFGEMWKLNICKFYLLEIIKTIFWEIFHALRRWQFLFSIYYVLLSLQDIYSFWILACIQQTYVSPLVRKKTKEWYI